MSNYTVTLKNGGTATVGTLSAPDTYKALVSTTFGLTGYTGSVGAQGLVGAQGAQGFQGAQGVQGSIGTVNVNAQYVWTNNQTFNANVSLTAVTVNSITTTSYANIATTLAAGNTAVTGIISFTDRIQATGPCNSQNGYAELNAPINSSQTGQQNMVSVQGQVSPQGAGTLTALYGLLFLPSIVSSANNITNIFPVFGRVDSASSYTGTVTNLNTFTAASPTWNSATAISNIYHYTAENATATTNVIGFRSLITSGAGKYNFYGSGNASNYFAGNVGIANTSPTSQLHVTGNTFISGSVGIGGTPSSSIPFAVSKSLTACTSSFGISQSGAVLSDVTGTAKGYNNSLTVPTNTTFTLTNYFHFGTIHTRPAILNTTISTLAGFNADAALVSGVVNYGFFSQIPSSSASTISNVSLTTNVVTVTTAAAHAFWPGQTVVVAATTTTSINGSYVITACPSTTTFTYALVLADITSVADTGTATVSTGRWNAYMSGSAPNHFLGQVGIGTTNLTSGYLNIAGTQSIAQSMSYVGGQNQTTTSTPIGLQVSSTLAGSATTITGAYGIQTNPSGVFANTITNFSGIHVTPNLAGANTPTNYYGVFSQHFYSAAALGGPVTLAANYIAASPSINASATANVTTQVGFRASSMANGALNTITNIYAFQGLQNSTAYSNAYNLFMNGNAANYMAGNLGIANTLPNATLAVTGTANISGVVTFGSTLTVTGNVTTSGLFTGNTGNNFAIGYRDRPQNFTNTSFAFAIGDAGKHILTQNSGASTQTITIPNTASVGYQTGATIDIIIQSTGTVVLANGAGVTMYLAGNSTAKSTITLNTYSQSTVMKIGADTWFVRSTSAV